MEGSQRKPSKRTAEPIDEWLQSQGLFRKHAPKDPTCLFRAMSEQIYSTQHFHIRVRRECVNFMKKHKDAFIKKIAVPFDSYIDQMACFTEWGGMNEIEAMSELYQKEIIIYDGNTLTKMMINNNDYKNHILLCYTAQKQYESVYTHEYIRTAAFCQSLVYKTLYKDVFEMPNVDETVHKMLHDRSQPLKMEKFSLKGNAENRESSAIEMLNKANEGCTESEENLSHKGGFTPFPYRVAKALDEDIFRNTDFDIWHEIRREVRNSGFSKYNGNDFQVGGKCLVELNSKDDLTNNNELSAINKKCDINCEEASGNIEKLLTGHIQEMSKNEGPVVVFILELGEKRTVPYSSLKPFNVKRIKPNTFTIPKKNPVVDPSPLKLKKPFGSNRRIKEPSTFERNSKGSFNKRNCETMKWMEESSENKAAFVKSCVENYNPPAEDFTADLDVPDEREKNTVPSIGNEENMKTMCPPNPVIANGPENNYQFQPPPQNVTYFLPPSENNNFQQIVSPSVNDVLPNVDFLLDQTNHPINMSAAKSIDVNGSDLPLSDLQTLRFFYNLGIQYLNAANYLCSVNHPPVNGQYNNFPLENSPEQKLNSIPESQEDFNQTTQMQPKYGSRGKKENGDSGFKGTFNHKTLKNSNVRFNGTQESIAQNNSQRNPKEFNKNVQYCNNERSREHINESKDVPRTPRNGVAPRFKKSIDGRNRNFIQPTRRNQQREVFCQRARLYRFDSNAKEWQERDVGEMKILHHVEYDSFEILLRGEEGHRVVCDMLLTADMDFEPLQTSDRAWIWAGLNHYDGQGNLEKLAAKFKNAELASQFKECIDMAQQALRERPRTKQEKENISDSIDPIKIDSNMFEKRAILFAQNDETWTKLGMGYVKMFYDSNIFGARIIMKIHNTDEIISSTIISIDTSIQILDKECMWKAFDCALNPPERRLLNAVFSSHQDAKQMFMSFKDIQHYAKEAIRNQLGS